ncbi:MAG: dTMP kinase [Parachlamydiaceae bacterium]
MTKPRGVFIAFEGGEGAGKTTIVSAIAAALEARGIEVVKTREPGLTPLGEEIRSLLLQKKEGRSICDKAELLLFLASRAQNIEEIIKPALERGAWVLCDRFNDSTIAYQGWARGLGMENVESLCSWVCAEIVPSITFFLSIDPAIGLERTRKVSSLDRIESEEGDFHLRVQEGFNQIAISHPGHFTFIDASQDKETVVKAVWDTILDKLGREF